MRDLYSEMFERRSRRREPPPGRSHPQETYSEIERMTRYIKDWQKSNITPRMARYPRFYYASPEECAIYWVLEAERQANTAFRVGRRRR